MAAENGRFAPLKDAATRLIIGRIVREEARLFDPCIPEFSHGFDAFNEAYSQYIKGGYFPILLSNHQTHADGIPHAMVADGLTYMAQLADPYRQFPGFFLPIATSVETGDQGTFLQNTLQQLMVPFEKRNLHLMLYTRNKDSKVYGTPANKISFMKKLMGYFKHGYGLTLLPEASVQGGRTNKETGEIYGMQPFTGANIELILTLLTREEKQPVFIPMGIHGTYRWQSPEKRRAAIKPALILFFTSQEMPPIQVRVGMPLTLDDLLSRVQNDDSTQSRSLVDILGYEVAQLVPPEARGVYR